MAEVERYHVALLRQHMNLPPLVRNSKTFNYKSSSVHHYFTVTVPAGTNLNFRSVADLFKTHGYVFDAVTVCELISDAETEYPNDRDGSEAVIRALNAGHDSRLHEPPDEEVRDTPDSTTRYYI